MSGVYDIYYLEVSQTTEEEMHDIICLWVSHSPNNYTEAEEQMYIDYALKSIHMKARAIAWYYETYLQKSLKEL